jgi:hypothetical protein
VFAGFLGQKFGSVEPIPHEGSVLEPEALIPVRQKLLILVDIHKGDPGRCRSGSKPDLDTQNSIRQTRRIGFGISSKSLSGGPGVLEFLPKRESF